MARFTEKYWNGRWWPREEWEAMLAEQRAHRPGGPNVISDHLDHVHNPVDGKTYDSKSRYYAAVKAAGCEILGNDTSFNKPPEPKTVITGRDVKEAIEQLRARHG